MANTLDPSHAVYVGSFDPPTLGHWDIISRGAGIFDRLTVAIGVNPEKTPLFSSDERLKLVSELVVPLKNVEVLCFEGLAVDFVRERGAAVMLRGMRTLTDIESEFTLTLANRSLAPEIETVFLMASEQYTSVSSSLIKQIAQMGQAGSAAQLVEFVPESVIEPLLAKFHD
ncbi:MAG: pantetheine-phosphate adenylyltransferase [Planctomycetaceae bacterium]|jgi:pantetheine-phosphate adenylyltransferase|nr:pantetheine-phosphate adenylyltransferase [Planctomycetaceae bacterium]